MSDNHLPSLDVLEPQLANTYPTAVSLIFERYREARSRSLEIQYISLINELLEVFVEFLFTVAFSEARENIRDFKLKLPEDVRDLTFLKKPGIGSWLFVLTKLLKLKNESTNLIWMPKISDWLYQRENDETRAVLEVLSSLPDVRVDVNTKKPIYDLVNILKELRNNFSHLRPPSNEELSKRIPAVESAIAHLLKSATFLSEMVLIYAERVEVTSNDGRSIQARVFRGTIAPEIKLYKSEKPIAPAKLYLTVARDEGTIDHVLQILPLLLWQVGKGQSEPELFFYRRSYNKELLYQSLKTDHELYTKLSSFDDLVDLSIEPGSIEDPYHDLTAEERSERADDLYKRAIWLARHNRLIFALECLEEAAELESTWRVYLKIAEVLEGLNAPKDNITAALEMSLKLDPGNADAQRMISRIESGDYRGGINPVAKGQTKNKEITIFHLFCPRILRRQAIPAWLGFVSFWYLFSIWLEHSIGSNRFVIAELFALLGCLTVIIAAGVLRPWVAWLDSCLHQQMYDRGDEPFEDWYRKQQNLIFGYFYFDNGVLSVWRSILREKAYYAGGIIWIAVMVTAAMQFSQSMSATTPLLIKRLIDYVLLFAVVYAAARYTVAVTMFLNHLSRRELKPMLTKINEDGVRALGPFIAFSIALATVVYSLFHLSFAFAYTTPEHIDFWFLCIGTAIAAAWTIAFPFQLRRALKASKLSPVQKYSQHIKNAFEAFINEPDEWNEKRYVRVLEMQKLLKRIPVWPLTAAETILVIGGCNLLLALVAAAYVISRLGSWDAVSNFISQFWR